MQTIKETVQDDGSVVRVTTTTQTFRAPQYKNIQAMEKKQADRLKDIADKAKVQSDASTATLAESEAKIEK